MDQFFSFGSPLVTIGDIYHFTYLVIIVVLVIATVYFRNSIKKYEKAVMIGILLITILQWVVGNAYHVYFGTYTLEESLPLHICRLVCLLIIIQFFLRKNWLDQVIFFWGLFAYGAFIYPVDISRPTHITGITFLILHSLNVLFPLIRYFTVGFLPTFKGSMIASALFAVYLPAMAVTNRWLDSNYFYIEDRPFFHDMGNLTYFLVNLIGVCVSFLIIGWIFQRMTYKLQQFEKE